MRKALALTSLVAAMLSGIGCSSLQYEERRADGGVISFKSSERHEAMAQLRKDYGDVDIIAESPSKTAQPGGSFDPSAPVKPSERVTAGPFSSILGGNEDKVQVKFSKKPTAGTTPNGLPPAPTDDGLVQAGFQSVSAYDRKMSNQPRPNLGGVSKPIQGVVERIDGACSTGK
jgi:hypothetical protein